MNPTEELRGKSAVDLIDLASEAVRVVIAELEQVNLRAFPPKQQRFDAWALALRESLEFCNEIKERIAKETDKRARYNDTKQEKRRAESESGFTWNADDADKHAGDAEKQEEVAS